MADKEPKKHKPETGKEKEEKKELNDSVEKPEHETEERQEGEHEILPEPETPKQNWPQRFWQWCISHKKFSIPIAVLALLAVLAAVPFTRYLLAGTVIKQSFPVVVVDAETGKPVSSATVILNGQNATTDSEGMAVIKTKVGYATLIVDKKYYENSSEKVTVPIKKPKSAHVVTFKATGRAVPVTVHNKISQKPATNVTIKAVDEDTEAKTDKEGKATLVVPADKQEIKVSLSGEGFNGIEATIKVTSDDDPANTLQITPSGKIYFLSNASGKIDLIKSNLDGTDRQTVLAGTGKEDRYNTVLLASRDWKYIALLSKRDGGEYAKLFLIETTNGDKLTVMDEGEATFDMRGWSGDRFIYVVNRAKVQHYQPKRETIKSYNVTNKKITALADNAAQGDGTSYAYEDFESINIVDEKVIYTISWRTGRISSFYPDLTSGKKASINSVQTDGSQKKTVKSYDFPYLGSRTADFGEIYILIEDSEKGRVEEYHEGKVDATNITRDEFYNEAYPTYAVSPSGKKTLWSDYRDGKYLIFVGDGKGENGKEIGRSDEYTVYGWFTDDYILLTKKGSEMRIMPANGLDGGVEKSSKITDYYKPEGYYGRGFGYGYGG